MEHLRPFFFSWAEKNADPQTSPPKTRAGIFDARGIPCHDLCSSVRCQKINGRFLCIGCATFWVGKRKKTVGEDDFFQSFSKIQFFQKQQSDE